jgi:hypothetical protein
MLWNVSASFDVNPFQAAAPWPGSIHLGYLKFLRIVAHPDQLLGQS